MSYTIENDYKTFDRAVSRRDVDERTARRAADALRRSAVEALRAGADESSGEDRRRLRELASAVESFQLMERGSRDAGLYVAGGLRAFRTMLLLASDVCIEDGPEVRRANDPGFRIWHDAAERLREAESAAQLCWDIYQDEDGR
ncbi:hypothetical protein [Sorangium sp. So ce233]|uniref:hypothetical protein n=1 Tax=Sorangium sp. So ce233 TaxID=3133290 RepID=UPI003F60FB7B